MRITHLFISPAHNYFGHHGQPAGQAPVVELEEAVVVTEKASKGTTGWKEKYKGQVDLFSHEVWESLCADYGVGPRIQGVFRRNVIVSGADLNSLIGKELELREMVTAQPSAAPVTGWTRPFIPARRRL